jgi:PAS domain S-box-containing protein
MNKLHVISRNCWILAIASLLIAVVSFITAAGAGKILANIELGATAQPQKEDLLVSQQLLGALCFLSAASSCSAAALLFFLQKIQSEIKAVEQHQTTLRSILAPMRASAKEKVAPVQELEQLAANLMVELSDAKKKAKAVIEKSVDVICIIDVDSKFISVGPACQTAWGYLPDELENQPIMNIIESYPTDLDLHSVLGAAKSIARVVFECKLRKKSGDLIDTVWTAYWSASVAGLFTIVHDITERKRAEELIRTSEENLRLTLERLPAGVLIFSPAQRRVEFANSEAARLFEMSKDDLSKHSLIQLFDTAADEAALLAGESAYFKTNAIRKASARFPVEVSVNTLETNGETKKLLVFLDKTEQHELERLKGEFMAMIIHDIRSPLNSVTSMLDMLELDHKDEKHQRALRIRRNANQSISQVVRLINDLIDLEKIKAGKFELDCVDVEMKDVINQALEIVKPSLEDKQLTFDLATEVDDYCFGDPERLVQVLVNLLSNASKYAPEGSGIGIALSEDSDFLTVTIRDEGPGIPLEKQDKIFEKFEHASSIDASKKGGKGLGLAICKAIVSEHRGEIGVTSRPGGGSSFWFKIPRTVPS